MTQTTRMKRKRKKTIRMIWKSKEKNQENGGNFQKKRHLKLLPFHQSQYALYATGGLAYIIFLDSSSLDRAVNSLSKPRPWPTTEEPTGLAHYLALYGSLRPPLDVVQEHADTYIEAYEYELAKARQKSQYRKGEAIVDEDGFTLVTRGGAYGQTLGGGIAVASKKFQQTGQTRTRNNKKEKKGKEGFYAFQKAEKQRKELLDLKRRWEEDKAKVEKLKASRRFNPY